MSGNAFDPAFERGRVGREGWLELATGARVPLPSGRWSRLAAGDSALIAPCGGPTLDVGCGPGRLTAALAARGVTALGVDTSTTAVALTRARGASALCRDVFDRVPGEGRWRHALLADGNIGIGGDPVRLLRRMRELVVGGGSVLVETDGPGTGVRTARARVCGVGPWFDWAWLGADALGSLAHAARLRVQRSREHHGRWFTELSAP